MQNLKIASRLVYLVTALSTFSLAQKAWVSPTAFGTAASEIVINPGLDLVDLLPTGMTQNISGWDWLTDDKIVFTNWVWNYTVEPLGNIWVLSGMKAQDKTKITVTRYYPGNLREPLGVKVVNGDVYAVVKFGLLKFIDADKNGIAEDTVQVAPFPYKPEPDDGWNQYSLDLKYRGGFFYVGLPSETVGGGYPRYPVTPGRGTVAKINPVNKTLEFLVTGLRTPDGLGWGPDSNLFVTDNQGAWLPASKLIHVTGNRFFGLQPVELGNPSLVESPPAIWMPHQEASSSPTQPLMLEKGPYMGQFIVGDNVYGFLNRIALDKVKGEFQGALFHFTGGLTCGNHRLVQNANGDVYFGGLGSPINSWNEHGKMFGIQVARFNNKPNFEVKEILSRADGFTLHFSEAVGVSAEDTANYHLRQWSYKPTKDYGGPKLNNVALTLGVISVDPTRTYVHIKVNGLTAGRVVDFQFHKDLSSQAARPIWTGEAWYTLNRISDVTDFFPTAIGARTGKDSENCIKLSKSLGNYRLELPSGAYTNLSIRHLDGRIVWEKALTGESAVSFSPAQIRSGVYIVFLRNPSGITASKRIAIQ